LLARRVGLDFREATDALMEIERRIFAVVERGARRLQQERPGTSKVNEQDGE